MQKDTVDSDSSEAAEDHAAINARHALNFPVSIEGPCETGMSNFCHCFASSCIQNARQCRIDIDRSGRCLKCRDFGGCGLMVNGCALICLQERISSSGISLRK